jgi:carbon monoxide dehydrogenase subunit G
VEFDHAFTVASGVEETWQLLLDVERSGSCLPGASIVAVEGGNHLEGSVKVKLGPLNLTYVGTATVTERDENTRRVVLDATGQDARTASAAEVRVTAVLTAADDATQVAVHTELELTGKPAQFGHSVLDDVGAKMVAQFADSLGHVLDGSAVPAKKAAKKAAKKTVAKAAKKAAKKTVAKKAAKKAATHAASANVSESEPVPSFAAPGGIPPAPTLEDSPSVNGHTGGGPGNSPAQHANRPNPVQAALPVLVKRVAPVVGPAAVGLVIVLAIRRRRRNRRGR